MNFGTHNIPTVVATLILIAGMIDDLASRKVHNWLFLTCAGVALLTASLYGGGAGALQGLLGFGAAVAILLPLVLAKALGAGDMKIMAAFGLVTSWETVIHVAIYSIIWGAFFGFIRVLIKGEALNLIRNIFRIITRQKLQATQLHTIPYTVALLIGWMTYLTAGAS